MRIPHDLFDHGMQPHGASGSLRAPANRRLFRHGFLKLSRRR